MLLPQHVAWEWEEGCDFGRWKMSAQLSSPLQQGKQHHAEQAGPWLSRKEEAARYSLCWDSSVHALQRD